MSANHNIDFIHIVQCRLFSNSNIPRNARCWAHEIRTNPASVTQTDYLRNVNTDCGGKQWILFTLCCQFDTSFYLFAANKQEKKIIFLPGVREAVLRNSHQHIQRETAPSPCDFLASLSQATKIWRVSKAKPILSVYIQGKNDRIYGPVLKFICGFLPSSLEAMTTWKVPQVKPVCHSISYEIMTDTYC